MNVIQIKQMLDTIWPTGITPDAYPVLAGMIALSKGAGTPDLAQPPLKDHFVKGLVRGLTTPAQTAPSKSWAPLTWGLAREIQADLVQGKLSQAEIARKFNVSPKAISQIKQGLIWAAKEAKPTPPSSAAVLTRTPMAKVHDHLHKGPNTQKGLAKALGLGPWAVKRALWKLVREGRVERHETVQGPHLYGIKK